MSDRILAIDELKLLIGLEKSLIIIKIIVQQILVGDLINRRD